MKVLCVSANLRLSPKREDQVTQYAFTQADVVQGHPGDVCFDGAIRLHVPVDDKQYEVGKIYELEIKCSI